MEEPLQMIRYTTLCVALALAGCASSPLTSESTDRWTPSDAVAKDPAPQPHPVHIPLTKTNTPLKPIEPASAPGLGVTAVALPDDIWDRMRKGFAMPDLDNALVRQHEKWYAGRPEYIERMTDRANRYLYYIVEEVQARKMPLELALLPFIESAFNPEALSSAKASGMWQFMPRTGTQFDLKQNAFRDDRLDVIASTRAALDYLNQLHGQFGDWHLALAAYNWGQGNVARAQATNSRQGKGTGYEDLNMPNETRNYVPKFQAIKNLIADPQRFGLNLRVIKNHPYFQAVPLKVDIDVALAAQLAGLSVEELKQLNPSAKRPLLMGAVTDELLLPWDNAEIFSKNFNRHTGAFASWTAWLAPRDLKVREAAQLTQMDVDELRQINGIPNLNSIIRKGSALVVPRKNGQSDVSEQIADTGQLNLAAERLAKAKTVRVQKGDTLASLARKHQVTPHQLAEWNRMKEGQALRVGQTLVVSPGTLVASKNAKSTTTAAAQHKKKAKR
ncbi:MAG: LysM peptidoglycan-binding domain-containing protein [Betaproteobacteria bacterium]|jgi:membrane-bound lytic murein transglycosylase D|nr:LysM peptidoglycan-binding domain-containing protein [Betaproteobacteria bacterium]